MSSKLALLANTVFAFWLLSSGVAGYAPVQTPVEPVARLLLVDAIEEAEGILRALPETAAVLAFKGEIEFRRAKFEAARAYYTRALDLDPDTGRALFGLGKLAMGQMRLAQAIDSLSRAVELEPEVPVYRLALAEAWAYEGEVDEQARQLEAYIALEPTYDLERRGQVAAALDVIGDFGPVQIGAYALPEATGPITFSQRLNLIFANVMVGDRGPYQFIVDTGASHTVFSERLLDELELNPITSTVIYGIGGDGRVDSGIYRIDLLTFGDIEVRNLPVGTLSDPLMGELADGIFSTATFGREVISIDYPDSHIAFNEAGNDTLRERISAWIFSNLVFIPMRINPDYEGLFLVDTGAATSVLSHRAAAELGITEDTPGAEISQELAGIAGSSGPVLIVPGVTLSTAQSQTSFPLMIAIDLDEISRTLGVEVAGVVGYDFLAEYRVSIDFNNAAVDLSR